MMSANVVSPGLVKSGLRRFWPLWLCGFVGLVMLFDIPVYTASTQIAGQITSLANQQDTMRNMWSIIRIVAWCYGLVGAIIVAVALNEHLFDGRAATFMGSLPQRRASVFASFAASGLLVLVALPVAACLLLLPLRAVIGSLLLFGEVAEWCAAAVVCAVVSYAFALLSCHLAGTRPVALLIYVAINLLAVCVEQAVRLLVGALMYGMGADGMLFDVLSPALWLAGAVIRFDLGEGILWGRVVPYLAAAVAVMVLAAKLYDRRNLEAAGDGVTFAPLRPVLAGLAGVSLALLFGSIYRLLALSDAMSGLPMSQTEALVLAFLMMAGSFLGVLFAEMIMSRSTHVLARCWRGGLALSLVAAVLVGVCHFDVLGVARYVPNPSDVKEVALGIDYYGSDYTLTSAEGIAQACDLQRDIISYGGEGNRDDARFTIHMRYHLKNGHTVSRAYPVISNYFAYQSEEEAPNQGALLVERFADLADGDEGRASRWGELLSIPADKLSLELSYLYEDGDYRTVTLRQGDCADFIEQALRPDLMEEPAGEVFYTMGLKPIATDDATLQVLEPVPTDPESSTVRLSLQLGEGGTPHIIAWLNEHYPDVRLRPVW